jgi:HK97 family phage prohead protease
MEANLSADFERRFIPSELRVDQKGFIEGYAAVFNQWSEILGMFKERIRAGAFKKTIKEADVRALFNHDPNYVLGRKKAGNLDLAEDSQGLHFRVKPPNGNWAKDLLESIQRGDIDQASFGFGVVRDEWDRQKDPAERELLEVKLYDVSVVTFPAYPQTSVAARAHLGSFGGSPVPVAMIRRRQLEIARLRG